MGRRQQAEHTHERQQGIRRGGMEEEGLLPPSSALCWRAFATRMALLSPLAAAVLSLSPPRDWGASGRPDYSRTLKALSSSHLSASHRCALHSVQRVLSISLCSVQHLSSSLLSPSHRCAACTTAR